MCEWCISCLAAVCVFFDGFELSCELQPANSLIKDHMEATDKQRKWQQRTTLRDASNVLEQPALKGKQKPSSTPVADKENDPRGTRTTRLSVGKTTGTPIRKRTGVVTRASASKLPTPPAAISSAGQKPRVARAFGRAVTQTRPRTSTGSAADSSAGKGPATAGVTTGRTTRSTAAGTAAARCNRSILTAATPAAAPAAGAAALKGTPAAAPERQQQEQAQPASAQPADRRRRISGTHNRQLGMDKLQSEYEALQQKLALLKRDTNRDHGRLQSTPMSAAQPRKPDLTVSATTAGAIAAAAATVSTGPSDNTVLAAAAAAAGGNSVMHATSNGNGDTGSLAITALQSCENLQLHCSIPDAAGIMQSLQFGGKYPGSRLAQLAGCTFSDAEFLASCEHALSVQLQRTKDGATDKSRIAELAGGWNEVRSPPYAA